MVAAVPAAGAVGEEFAHQQLRYCASAQRTGSPHHTQMLHPGVLRGVGATRQSEKVPGLLSRDSSILGSLVKNAGRLRTEQITTARALIGRSSSRQSLEHTFCTGRSSQQRGRQDSSLPAWTRNQ